MGGVVVYGAYGYTGELVAREAVDAGFDPVLAGRREEPLGAVADDLGVDHRVAALGDLERMLGEVDPDLLVHCAGPFVDTYEPAAEACLSTGTHYLDVTGEIPALSGIRARDAAAREASVMLLPGAGFDVVPSDCLVARLHERLPGADRLTIAFEGLEHVSPGTARTGMRLLGEGVTVREDGDLRRVPFGGRVREIDTGVGDGALRMGVLPWGDVVTAHHTTGIPNVEVYASDVLGLGVTGQRALGRLQPLLGRRAVRRALVGLVDRVASGPDAAERAAGGEYYWAEVTDGDRTVTGRVHTPESYQFTVEMVTDIVGRVLDGDAPPGFQSPASAYGSDLVLAADGARFEDIEEEPA